jgi:hypothetical protein
VLVAVMSIAAILYPRSSGESVWVRLIVPRLAFAGLAAGVVIIVYNFDALAGQSTLSNLLPWAFPVIAALGYAQGVIHGCCRPNTAPASNRRENEIGAGLTR